MAGRGTISVNQSPSYGDKTALDNTSKALTQIPGTDAVEPARGAGRPPTGRQAEQMQQVEQVLEPAPVTMQDDHRSMIQELAQAYRTKQFWDRVLQESPSEWSRMYARDANRVYAQIYARVRDNTPFFED